MVGRTAMRRARHPPLFWLTILVASAAAGLLYDRLFGLGRPFVGATYGVLMALPMLAFELGLLAPALQRAIQRLPTLAAIPAAEAVYVVLMTLGYAAAGLILSAARIIDDPLGDAVVPSGRVLLYTLAVSAVVVSVIRVRELIGSEVFLSLLIGRYHRPVREERVFLFIDLVGSTRFAEAHGDVRAQEFLAAFFAVMAEPVRSHRGSIDDYVGDMALVTWPLARGLRNAACVACVFDLEELIARHAAAWRERFGAVPRFRAALHAGPIVTAEIGVDRHKIAYFGDTVNATARIETLAKTLDEPVLVSLDLLDRLPFLPMGVAARRLGEHTVRGRDQPIAVAALGAAGRLVPGQRPPERATAS